MHQTTHFSENGCMQACALHFSHISSMHNNSTKYIVKNNDRLKAIQMGASINNKNEWNVLACATKRKLCSVPEKFLNRRWRTMLLGIFHGNFSGNFSSFILPCCSLLLLLRRRCWLASLRGLYILIFIINSQLLFKG